MEMIGGGENAVLLLHENESASIESYGGSTVTLAKKGQSGDDSRFVRRMPPPSKLGVLDILDIVSGGDGLGAARGAGIDPSSGTKAVDLLHGPPIDGGGYRTVDWNPLVDGAFIPDGKAGDVQIDSAGNVFAGFPATTAVTHSPIWARAADVSPTEHARYKTFWMFNALGNWQYMPKRRGLLAMHANVGLTFDLDAIRRAHPDIVRLHGFHAWIGMMHEKGNAEIWAFADGMLKYHRKELVEVNGGVSIDVPLNQDSRFLTLVVTDGDEPSRDQYDWVVFGDPVLRVAIRQPEQANPTTKNEKEEKNKTR